MIEAYDELYYWQELRYGIEHQIGQIDEYRREVQETPWEVTPEFDRLEELLNDITEYIDGRMQELAPDRVSEHVYSREARQLAQEALSKGINYFGLSHLTPEDKTRAMEYITEHGLASMSYDKTRRAVQEFRKEDLQALLKRHGRKNKVLILSH